MWLNTNNDFEKVYKAEESEGGEIAIYHFVSFSVFV